MVLVFKKTQDDRILTKISYFEVNFILNLEGTHICVQNNFLYVKAISSYRKLPVTIIEVIMSVKLPLL